MAKRDGKEISRTERTYDDFVILQSALKVSPPVPVAMDSPRAVVVPRRVCRRAMPRTRAVVVPRRFGLHARLPSPRLLPVHACVRARYSAVQALLPSVSLPLPPKKAFGSMDMAFLTERLRGLTLFLDLLQEYKVLLHQNATLDFVGLPGSGSGFLGTTPAGRTDPNTTT